MVLGVVLSQKSNSILSIEVIDLGVVGFFFLQRQTQPITLSVTIEPVLPVQISASRHKVSPVPMVSALAHHRIRGILGLLPVSTSE